MADRVDFHFRQRVTEAELDLAFELLEQADRDLAADIGLFGVVSGAVPIQHTPVPDLTVDLTSPTWAYDRLGQRIFVGTDQTVDCSADLVGIPTSVAVAGNERWLGVFLRFTRQLSDPRTDGNAQQVYFRRDESFEIVVRQAPESVAGGASKVALQADELLVGDIRLLFGQTQLLDADIDTTRRQAFVFTQGDAVAVAPAPWSTLAPVVGTVQATLDEVDAELTDHFSAADRRHTAADVDFSPHGPLTASTVQGALAEFVDDLAATDAGSPGAQHIGADAVVGTPHGLGPGSVDSHLSLLLGWLNDHIGAVTSAHNASAIAAQPHADISATNVQAQLQEIVTDLAAQDGGDSGADKVGASAYTPTEGFPVLTAGTLVVQLQQLSDAIADLHTYRLSAPTLFKAFGSRGSPILLPAGDTVVVANTAYSNPFPADLGFPHDVTVYARGVGWADLWGRAPMAVGVDLWIEWNAATLTWEIKVQNASGQAYECFGYVWARGNQGGFL